MKKLLSIISILLFSFGALAHSGGTDKYGCHHDRKNGGYHCHKSAEAREVSSEDYMVSFNQKSHIYHRPGCKSAKACTVNCIPVQKSEAISRGARACGVCGGQADLIKMFI